MILGRTIVVAKKPHRISHRNFVSKLWKNLLAICYWETKIKSDEKITTHHTQLAFTCSKLTAETLEQGAKYVQS